MHPLNPRIENRSRSRIRIIFLRYVLITIKAIVTELDFFMAITQESFEIYNKFFIRKEETIFLLHEGGGGDPASGNYSDLNPCQLVDVTVEVCQVWLLLIIDHRDSNSF